MFFRKRTISAFAQSFNYHLNLLQSNSYGLADPAFYVPQRGRQKPRNARQKAAFASRKGPMRKSTAVFTFIILSVATLAWAARSLADEKIAITAVAQNYMDAYYTADVARMQQTLHPEFHKRTLRTVNGQLEVREDSVQSMLEGVRSGTGKDVPPAERVQKYRYPRCLQECRQR
jgi:Putative lumazine-binding